MQLFLKVMLDLFYNKSLNHIRLKSKVQNNSDALPFLFKCAAVLLLFILTGYASYSATITSTASGGNWSATGSWSGGVVPTSADDVVIANGATITVDNNFTCNSVSFTTGASGSGAGTLTVNSGFQLSVTTSITAPGDKNNGLYTISGSGTLACSSLVVNNTSSPSGSASTSIRIISTVTVFNISGNLVMNSTHTNGGSKANNPTLDLQTGTLTVGGSVSFVFDANSNNTDDSATVTLLNGSANANLVLTGATPFSKTGTGGVYTKFNGTSAVVHYKGTSAQTIRATGITTYTTLKINNAAGATLDSATTLSALTI